MFVIRDPEFMSRSKARSLANESGHLGRGAAVLLRGFGWSSELAAYHRLVWLCIASRSAKAIPIDCAGRHW